MVYFDVERCPLSLKSSSPHTKATTSKFLCRSISLHFLAIFRISLALATFSSLLWALAFLKMDVRKL